MLSSLIDSILGNLKTNYELNRVEEFIRKTPELGIASASFQQGVETIKTNIRWLEQNKEALSSWISVNNVGTSSSTSTIVF